MTQKQPLTFTVAGAVGVRGAGEVSVHLVKFSPLLFPQMSDISRATSTPDIAPLRLLCHDGSGPACVSSGGSLELLSWCRVKTDGKEPDLSR